MIFMLIKFYLTHISREKIKIKVSMVPELKAALISFSSDTTLEDNCHKFYSERFQFVVWTSISSFKHLFTRVTTNYQGRVV